MEDVSFSGMDKLADEYNFGNRRGWLQKKEVSAEIF